MAFMEEKGEGFLCTSNASALPSHILGWSELNEVKFRYGSSLFVHLAYIIIFDTVAVEATNSL